MCFFLKKLALHWEIIILYDLCLQLTGPQYSDLCLADVLHCEVEPHSEARVAGIRADKEVKLKLTDVVNTAKVPCRDNKRTFISTG